MGNRPKANFPARAGRPFSSSRKGKKEKNGKIGNIYRRKMDGGNGTRHSYGILRSSLLGAGAKNVSFQLELTNLLAALVRARAPVSAA